MDIGNIKVGFNYYIYNNSQTHDAFCNIPLLKGLRNKILFGEQTKFNCTIFDQALIGNFECKILDKLQVWQLGKVMGMSE